MTPSPPGTAAYAAPASDTPTTTATPTRTARRRPRRTAALCTDRLATMTYLLHDDPPRRAPRPCSVGLRSARHVSREADPRSSVRRARPSLGGRPPPGPPGGGGPGNVPDTMRIDPAGWPFITVPLAPAAALAM